MCTLVNLRVCWRGFRSRVIGTLCRLAFGVVLWLMSLPLSAQTVTLAWQPSPDETVTGYRVHYGFSEGYHPMSVEVGLVTTSTLSLPLGGETYYFVATAHNVFGLESDDSNEVVHRLEGEPAQGLEQAITTPEDQPVTLPWGSSAGYTSHATWLPAVPPTLGRLEDEAGQPVYVPLTDAVGEDTAVYYVLDAPAAYRVVAHVTIVPVNDPPVALDLEAQTDPGVRVEVTLQGWDPDGEVHFAEIIAPPLAGTLQGGGLIWVYQPASGFEGLDRFIFVVSDGQTNSSPATAWIWVGPPGDRPVALDLDLRTDEDVPLGVTLEGHDPDWRLLSFEIQESPLHGRLEGQGAQWVYVPAANYHGLDAFRYVVSNGLTNSEPATVEIVVAPVNDQPVAYDVEVATAEDTGVVVTPVAEDVDGDPLTFEMTSPPLHGTVQVLETMWVYQPDADFHGTDEFHYVGRDGATSSAPATVRLVIEPVNDRPAVQSLEVTTREDTVVEVTLVGHDPDGDSLTFEIVSPPVHGTLQGQGAAWVYQPYPDFHGSDEFVYDARDGTTNSAPASVRIAVEAVNDPPVAHDATYRVVEDTGRDIVLEGSDVEGDPLTFHIAEAPAHGTLSGTPPLLWYVPEPGYQGTDTIGFLVSDGLLDSARGVATLDVLPRAAFETRIGIEIEGDQLRLSWPAVAGERYRVWHRSDLSDGSWVQIAEVPPVDSGQATVTILVPAVEGYYRCEVVVY